MKSYSLGIPDAEFIRGDAPMTKREIRILTLALAAIRSGDTVLDVGAGTGSLTVEAALLSSPGRVYAVEPADAARKLLAKNLGKFACSNVVVLAGCAPEVMPEPSLPLDVVLVGGSGGQLAGILAAADRRLKVGGRLVVNIVTLETLAEASGLFKNVYQEKYCYEIIAAQITRMQEAGRYNLFRALNPVYILSAQKKGE